MDYAPVLDEIFSQIKGVSFSIKLWNGREYFYGTNHPPVFTLIVKDEKTAQRLLSEGSLGFGESYMEGKIDVEGDIDEYLRLRHQFKHVRRSPRLILATLFARKKLLKNRKDQISHHYDLGNDFFQLLLEDETMSYSAGYYEQGNEGYTLAQQKKVALLCQWLDLPSEASVLDLGSGWGGFARHVAVHKGWHVTGYTLSNEQLTHCRQSIQKENLEKLISFEYKDMLEELPNVSFDGAIMIESIEHVGQKNLTSFFKKLHTVIKPGGPLVLQLTGRYKPHPVDKWTLKYVFPGGYLPAKEELIEAAKQAGFGVEEFRDDTPDYIKTMTEWITNLEKQQQTIEQKFGKPFYRLWYLWMHGARVAFEVHSMNLFRLRLRRLR